MLYVVKLMTSGLFVSQYYTPFLRGRGLTPLEIQKVSEIIRCSPVKYYFRLLLNSCFYSSILQTIQKISVVPHTRLQNRKELF